MAEVFVSYAREDRARAKQVVAVLEREGFRVFWDRELLPGPSFRHEIARELADAQCVIALWTRTSIESDWVVDEAEKGHRRHVLVSALLDDVDLPLGLGQGHAADLRTWHGQRHHKGIDLLIHGVRRLVRRVPAVPPPGEDDASTRPPDVVGPPTPRPRPSLARHPALAPTLLLLGIFAVNVLETAFDAHLSWLTGLGKGVEYPVAEGFRWFERGLTFDGQDAMGAVAYIGYSLSYFFVFPALAVGVALALATRPDPLPYRAFSLAVATDYLASLPFFLFLPVPERWFQADTGAMLLSDKWSEALIEAIRPMSALDNSFPSFHVSLTVLIVTACYAFDVRLRTCVAALGGTVVLATFALGIHWIPDILAGLCLGVASLLLATRWVDAAGLASLWSPFGTG